MRHPSIVSMLGYCKKDNYICLITEFIEGGTLNDVIFGPYPYDPIAIAIAICRGMVFIHNKGIIHRDLKPSTLISLSFP